MESKKKQSTENFIKYHSTLAVPILSPPDFANAIGYSLDRITKSVLFKAKDSSRYVMACCSVSKKFDLTHIALLPGLKKLELASPEELLQMTEYPPRGVSPLALPEGLPVYIDDALLGFQTVLVGAGEAGAEIEIAPAELVRITGAFVTTITKRLP